MVVSESPIPQKSKVGMTRDLILHKVLAVIVEISRYGGQVHIQRQRRARAPIAGIVMQDPIRRYDPQLEANLVPGMGDPNPHHILRYLIPPPHTPFVLAPIAAEEHPAESRDHLEGGGVRQSVHDAAILEEVKVPVIHRFEYRARRDFGEHVPLVL